MSEVSGRSIVDIAWEITKLAFTNIGNRAYVNGTPAERAEMLGATFNATHKQITEIESGSAQDQFNALKEVFTK